MRWRVKKLQNASFVFVRFGNSSAPASWLHNLAQVASGPHWVIKVKDKTIAILREYLGDRVSEKEAVPTDRVQVAMSPSTPPTGSMGPPGQRPAMTDADEPLVDSLIGHRQQPNSSEGALRSLLVEISTNVRPVGRTNPKPSPQHGCCLPPAQQSSTTSEHGLRSSGLTRKHPNHRLLERHCTPAHSLIRRRTAGEHLLQ